jgi:hypothetical protein
MARRVSETGAVPAYCTCGAQLAEDALFCHKCGKPQREIAPPELDEAAPEGFFRAEVQQVLAEAAALPPGINFQNRTAVRTALLSALLATLLMQLPLPVFLAVFWFLVCMMAAGFVAVYLYHRRTGETLTVRNGVRMGWLTGVFSFVITLVLSLPVLILVQQQGGLASALREQMEKTAAPGLNVEDAMRVLESPVALGMMLLFVLGIYFLVFIGVTIIGGALGAKVLEKE